MEQRTIKFKAKRLDNGEWAEGDLQHRASLAKGEQVYKTIIATPIKSNHAEILGHNLYEVDPSTVCQFVGFEDINRNKVYEHDIVRNIQTEDEFELIWHNSLLGFYFYKEGEIYKRQGIEVIIVGNRFDRKEGEK